MLHMESFFIFTWFSLVFHVDSNCIVMYCINNGCVLLSISSVMKSIFVVGLSFYARTYRTKAQLDACFANSHVTRDDFLQGIFFCLPGEQSNSHFVRCSSRAIASRRRSCKPRWSRRLKRYFSFVAVYVCVCACARSRNSTGTESAGGISRVRVHPRARALRARVCTTAVHNVRERVGR